MHLIPASWSHLHILVSVFPSVGLVFALGFYVTAIRTNNEMMKRVCLVAFGVLGLLAIPTYISGDGSAVALAHDPKISMDRIDNHYGWSMAALTLLALTGIAAWYELWRFARIGRLSNNAVHLVLGLAVMTLAFMIVVGELGWEISHHELQAALRASPGVSASDIPEGEGTSQGWSHVHMILNHFPTVGFTFALAFFIAGLVMNNDVIKRTCLVVFTICAILGAPTYVTGAAAMWALTDPPILGISKAAIDAHRDMAILTLFGLAFTGGAAWMVLWRYRYTGKFTSRSLNIVLVFAIITFGIMAETGHRGGQINHPEIRTEAVPTSEAGYWSPQIENLINNVIWFVPWQTVHFFGYSLVFATVLAVVLRILGFWKSVPFSAVHRLLPLGVFGVIMNVFTGMLMLMADTYRYVNETSFTPKMILLPIGAIAVLYFSLSDPLWEVKAGEDAPMAAKWVAVIVLLSWIGVIMGGRLLPYV
ncbi:MAG TPA: DUF2231 domain-containing protein [Micropepsaceae bacterium]|jgi:uncharacterized membrane protein|nr:DUF2231 domain-containing protein [Micropepsaceae bacterium]